MLVGLDLPSADRGTETRVQSPLQGKCLSQRRNIKAESETADLWQPKWNENQTVLEAAICTPDRDTGPLEGAAAAKSLQSCPTLCDHLDGSPPGSSIPGILQARILEWVAISLSNACMHAKLPQSCPTLCDPMDSSPPGSSIQA